MNYLFTSESVSEGHPDKVADQISDALLDEFLAYDRNSKVACETLVTTGQVVLAGEVKSNTYVDVAEVARDVIAKIGYTKSEYRFEAQSCGVFSSIHEQSDDINRGVDQKADPMDQGAGDQGMMFGYATDETDNYMPLSLDLSHALLLELANIRKNESELMPYLRPDAKSQVTVEYAEDGTPLRIDTIVISTQHDEFETPRLDSREAALEADEKMRSRIETDVRTILIPRVQAQYKRRKDIHKLFEKEIKYYVNPTGKFVIGGPHGDTGLTGRKIIVDTYGGVARHGGGAFSGKDPTKVDRSAAYAARYAAKNIVAAGIADRCEIQLAYAIGVAHPVSVSIETYGTGKIPDEKIVELINTVFDFRPAGIIKALNLRRPIYKQLAAYGHFGRTDLNLPWEKTDKAAELRKLAGL